MVKLTSIFEHQNYKDFVQYRLSTLPKKGYGQYGKLARQLGVNAVVVSQIFKGDRELNMDQALEVSQFLGLSSLEEEYFLLLVQLARAGTSKLKAYIRVQMDRLRSEAGDLQKVVTRTQELSDEAKAIYYSSWYYSGTRLLLGSDERHTVPDLAERLGLPNEKMRYIVDFLLRHGLATEQNGSLRSAPSQTHLGANSPHISRHHTNWRMKGLERIEKIDEEELFYTGPMSIGEKDLARLRSELVQFIKQFSKQVADSPSEKLACLNIDLFKF